MQQVVRKDSENFESLLRRFTRKVHQSGALTIAKKKQFHERPVSKREQRQIALRKAVIKEKKARQLLMGS